MVTVMLPQRQLPVNESLKLATLCRLGSPVNSGMVVTKILQLKQVNQMYVNAKSFSRNAYVALVFLITYTPPRANPAGMI